MQSPFESNYFDQALELAKQWPEVKTVPMQLAELYMKSERHPTVGMFFEALIAAAQSEEDMLLLMQANQSLPDDDD